MRMDAARYKRPCSCGRSHSIEVKEIIIEPGAAEELLSSLKSGSLSGYRRPLIVTDTNIRKAEEELRTLEDTLSFVRFSEGVAETADLLSRLADRAGPGELGDGIRDAAKRLTDLRQSDPGKE